MEFVLVPFIVVLSGEGIVETFGTETIIQTTNPIIDERKSGFMKLINSKRN